MAITDHEELMKQRDYLVVKGNELIQKSRYQLSLQEQKTVAYICSMIKPATEKTISPYYPNCPWQLDYEFCIQDYCKICGIDYDGGKQYRDVKAALKKLSDRSMWIDFGDEEVLCRWLAKVRTNKKSGIAHIQVDPDLAPYLFDLQHKFTQYQLYNILAMSSAYSIRLYELLKSYSYLKEKIIDLDDLKQLLSVEDVKSYNRFPDFRRKVLEIAQKEINELTDLCVDYETICKGRKVVKIKFKINTKTPIERYLSGKSTMEKLDKIAPDQEEKRV